MQENNNKQLICKIAGEIIKNFRGNQSQFKFCAERGLSTSIISPLEKGIKDPQLTSIFKISEAMNMKASDFVKMIENELPENFSLLDTEE